MATVSSSNTIFSVACFYASHRFENYMSLQNKPLVDFLFLNQGFNAGEAGMKMEEGIASGSEKKKQCCGAGAGGAKII